MVVHDRFDNGLEYLCNELANCANSNQITLLYIQPGKPNQNAYIELFNQTGRREWLGMQAFDSIEHAQQQATQWLWQYNNGRLHKAICDVPPRYLLKGA